MQHECYLPHCQPHTSSTEPLTSESDQYFQKYNSVRKDPAFVYEEGGSKSTKQYSFRESLARKMGKAAVAKMLNSSANAKLIIRISDDIGSQNKM